MIYIFLKLKEFKFKMKFAIGYSGISHLSLNYAAITAEKGFKVIFYDKDLSLIDNPKSKEIEIFEPGLQKLLIKNKKKYYLQII